MAQPKAFRMIRDSQFARDSAVIETTVTLDTSKWSTRKKNIVLNALTLGVGACSWSLQHLIDEMLNALGSNLARTNHWYNSIDADMINPERLDELLAYTAAWVRMGLPADFSTRSYYGSHWVEGRFLEALERGETPVDIPLPKDITRKEQQEFIAYYIKDPSETDKIARQTLIAKINNGEKITLTHDFAI